MKWHILLLAFLLIGSAFAGDSSDESCDSSSDSSEEGHHHHGGGNGRPPRPRPPRPPPAPAPGPAPGPPSNRPTCDQDWFTSYRPQGIWCWRVGIGKMDYNGAIAQCATYGGILSGIQNDEERMLIANEANRQTLAYNIQYSGVWLGAQRNPTTNTFYWTDGHTTGTAGFHWGPNEPDNANTYGPENCIQLIALTQGYWNTPNGFFQSFRNGDLDDYWCNRNDNPETRMYACGKPGPPM